MAIKTRAAVAAEKMMQEKAEKEKTSEAAKVLSEARAREKDLDRPVERDEDTPKVDPDRIERLLAKRPHAQAMDEILAKHEEKEAEEAKQRGEEAKTEPAKAEDTVAAQDPAPAQDTVAAVEAVEPKKVKQVVDGEEYEVDQSEIDEAGGERAWRKQKAADNRLSKAAEANKQIQAQLAQVTQYLLAQNQPKAQPEPTGADLIKQKLDIIRFGTPEEASAAFAEVISKSQPKQLDQNLIVGQAIAAMQRHTAIKEFEAKNPHVMSNPLLLKLARQLEMEEIQAGLRSGQPLDWNKLYDKVALQVSSVVPPRQSQPAATQSTSTPSSVSEKEARKASITTIPTAAARAALPQEEKEPTSEEARNQWYAEQKKSRGQG